MLKQLKRELFKTFKGLQLEHFEGELKYAPEELNISERVVGGKVELINEDGTLSALPDGDYELTDGFKFTIKEGLIESIEGEEPVEEQAEEMADEAPIEEVSDPLADLKAETETLKAEVDALKQAIEEIKNGASNNATKEDVQGFQSEVSKLNETIMKLAKIPAEASKTTKSNIVKDSREEKMLEFAKLFKAKK